MEKGMFLFRPNYQTINDVFNGSNRYSIPDFQRQYSWEDEQVEELFDDIYGAFIRKEPYYFLGSIILTDSGNSSYEVIDGQQRLSTLTILFCVLRDKYFNDDKKITNRIENLENSQYRLSFQTHDENQNDFYHTIQKVGALVSIPDNEVMQGKHDENKFINAARILNSRLSDLTRWGDGTRSMNSFVDYLLKSVGVISIVCSDKKGAVRLFRTLNDRGLDLSTSDLIKSYLYDKAKDNYEQKMVVEDWKKIESLVNDTDDKDPDEMLTCFSYYLLGSYQKEAIYDRLEEKFNKMLEKESVQDIVHSIKNFAEIYKGIDSSKIKEVLSLWYLPNSLYWISVLATAKTKGWSEKNYIELAKYIRNIFYDYWIAGFTSAKLKQLTFDVIRSIEEDKGLNYIINLIKKKATEDDVENLAFGRMNRDADKESWIKPLLLLVEYNKTDDSKVDFIDTNRSLQLEHILPTEWKKNEEWRKIWIDEEADKWLHKIGNMALLLGRKNISAGNKAFNIKKDIYSGNGNNPGVTSFIITQEVIANSSWTTAEVSKRQSSLIKEIKEILEIP